MLNCIPAKQAMTMSSYTGATAISQPLPTLTFNPLSTTPKSSDDRPAIPACLKRLVRSVVRTFYSREHSLIVDLLVRHSIMNEDDLCSRLRFEKKQLRQYLHTLKSDQFVKLKMQLETDATGKSTKITHYFIDYRLFVNVVKYRLDHVQRRLESAGHRQSSTRASFRCPSCQTAYSDLEIDRLMVDLSDPGRLVCPYCQTEVVEQEDSGQRSDSRHLIAKFHQQIRDPIDAMLRECDSIHLPSSVLEPEIIPLAPIGPEDSFSASVKSNSQSADSQLSSTTEKVENDAIGTITPRTDPAIIRVEIIGGSSRGRRSNRSMSLLSRPKRPKLPEWFAASTIWQGVDPGLGDLDRGLPSTTPTINGSGASSSSHHGPSTSSNNLPSSTSATSNSTDHSITQTLAPGRVPTGLNASSTGNDPSSSASFADNINDAELMHMLMVHERGAKRAHQAASAGSSSTSASSSTTPSKGQSTLHKLLANRPSSPKKASEVMVRVGSRQLPFNQINRTIYNKMTSHEKQDYQRIAKELNAVGVSGIGHSSSQQLF